MTTPSKIKVCETCRGLIDPETLCATCIGSGWIWGDGVPATMCPGGGAAPAYALTTGKAPTDLPCGRSGETCPGCDRKASDIGGPEDRQRTIDWQTAKKETSSVAQTNVHTTGARTPIVRCGECTAAVGHFGDCVKGGAL